MLFSVIIPAYNAEKTISYCLESITNQDFPKNEYEIVVVDDCSPDNQNETINSYIYNSPNDHSNIRLIKHSENRRQGGARNTGIREANGEWIFFLDADDYWCTNNVFTVFASIIKKYSEEHCDIIESYTHNDISNYPEKIELQYISPKSLSIQKNTEFLLSTKYSGYIWRCCYRRSHIRDILFRENVFFEDGDWELRVLLKPTTVIAFDFPFYAYVNNPNSTIRKPNIEVFKANLLVNKIILNITKKITHPTVETKLRNRIKRNVFSYLKISKSYPIIQSLKVFKSSDMRVLTDFNNYNLTVKEKIVMGAMRYCPLTLISAIKGGVLSRRVLRKIFRKS